MILEREQHALALGRRQTRLNPVDAPAEGVLIRVAFDRRLIAFHLHQIIERRDGVPAPGIQTDAGNTEARGEFNAADGVLHRLLTLIGLLGNEILVNREHRQREPVAECGLFELPDIGRRFVGHLPMKNLDAVEPEPRGVVDDLLDRVLRVPEVPIRIGRHRETDVS